ncbi:hexokinase [Dysgonomonas sp. 216]|uniref:hexokinase n=1 Tax=Dysgonomonas sp. 216 TaxID=2302934 RepID=UPI0013D0E980|nr:hexokinase [Dysgonomonas sp. 216]NDW18078.1 hexokinase [Dysgonomonas sp. 216]
MKRNNFKLKTIQLKEIARSLQNNVKKGLENDNMEIQCLPTYINPNVGIKNGRALVLDLGGTNYRAAVVEFKNGVADIHPKNGWKKNLSVEMKRVDPAYTELELFKEIADLIDKLDLTGVEHIGYCFSYPAESKAKGEAILLRWTKGVNIPEMVPHLIGKPLMDYLNKNLKKANFKTIKVINDTVASLFAGLTHSGYDAYIGLIVGTGTNMATFVSADKIKKLDTKWLKKEDPKFDLSGLIPINLESGNFTPPYLTIIDDLVDANSDNVGAQRFEKTVSGMYLGEVLKAVFPCTEFEESFDAQKLTHIMSYPDIHKEKYVEVARSIYKRSAYMVASSLAGLILELISHNPDLKKVQLTAEGSLFWSEDRKGRNYKDLVLGKLNKLLSEFGHGEVQVHITSMENANLIGSAIAALS